MTRSRIVLLIVLVAAAVAFFVFDLDRFFTLEQVKSRQADLQAALQARPLLFSASFFAVYVAVAGLSLPGAALMTLLAGALFGLLWGTVLVSFASCIGATLAFLASRYLFRESIQARFGQRLAPINRGIERDGAFYLFTLRLVPVFPFWIVNLLMGLTPIATRTFYWVSQLGMLAGTVVYVNVGTQLAQLDSLKGILSPSLVLSFVALGVLPLIARKIIDAIQARRIYARWQKPRRFDRNVIVIGAGSGGLVTAYIAAAVKSKVTLIERHRMGGDCLNTGCVPSKALIKTARLLHQARHSADYGVRSMQAEVDFADVMARVHRVIREIEPHDSVERYRGLGVDCVIGNATIVDPWTVEIDEEGRTRRLTARNLVIAAGARPFVPPIPGIERTGYVTSDTMWSMTSLPARLVVLGGGPIGSELAQAFARLGSKVSQVEMAPRILAREDPEVSEAVTNAFRADGIDVLTGHKAERFEVDGTRKVLVARADGREVTIEFDMLLVAVGRAARVEGYGLEQLGVSLTRTRTVEVNALLQTNYPNIFAVGDVAGPYQFTHTAAHMAWFAAVNALFGRFKTFSVDYSVIPWCTFTDPEVARVGLSEAEAREKQIAVEVTRFDIAELDRAIADEAAHGFVKVLTVPGKDRILGVTIVGEHAGDLIAEYVTAMKYKLGLNKILGTIHIYPTLAEANKYAAGVWKRAHAPQRVLSWLERYHAWQIR